MNLVSTEDVSWTTDEILRRAARLGSERMAVVLGEDGNSLTYGELDEQASRMANVLRSVGVVRGDRVAVLMANRLEYIVAYHGVGRCGAVFVPIVTQSKLPELSYLLDHSEASVLIVDEKRWEVLAGGISSREFAFTHVHHVFLIGAAQTGDVLSLEDALRLASPDPVDDVPKPHDPVALMYTSGSTGRPKAVIHSHYTAVAQAEAVCTRMGYTSDDRLMTVFPLFHGNALVWSALAAVWVGARVIIHQRFSASGFWDSARRHGATEVNLLPGAINMVLAQPERADDRETPVRLVLANVTETIYDRFVKRFDVDIVSTWALAEGPLGTMTAPGHGYKAGEIGWPMGHDNEIRVVDSEDRELPPGEVGELVQRNRAVMIGYYKNEAETARVMRGGWMHSGDLGYRDNRGLFYFVGRSKHVIRRSGENISGEEVEECLLANRAVEEVAVVAVPDEMRGEEVKACIVVQSGHTLSPEAVVAWCEGRLADFKIPRYVEFLDVLPRTGPLKVDRPALSRRHLPTQCWDRIKNPGN
jgi:crotonobetaine/carnitine-CoA ligase